MHLFADLLSGDEINLLEEKFGPSASPSDGFYTKIYEWLTALHSGVSPFKDNIWTSTPSHTIKLVIAGEARCGKKTLSSTIQEERYSPSEEHRRHVGMMCTSWKVVDPTKFPPSAEPFGRIQAQLWDPCFQDRFRSVSRTFYREAHAVILAFAVDSRSSFEGLKSFWLIEALKHTPPTRRFVLVGLKCDLPQSMRHVTKHEGRMLAAELGCPYVECSAKSGHNVSKLIEYAVTVGLKAELIRKRPYIPPAPAPITASLQNVGRWLVSWLPFPSSELK
jgi:small GTP-binding protein